VPERFIFKVMKLGLVKNAGWNLFVKFTNLHAISPGVYAVPS
jgi:hypothetical protein